MTKSILASELGAGGESPCLFRILLVEDSDADAEMTRRAFLRERLSSHIEHVRDGLEALAYLRSNPLGRGPAIDLILLDLQMPRLDGFGFLLELRRDERLRHLPVTVLTTSQREQDVLASYQALANAYVAKPVDLNDFYEAIHQVNHFWQTTVRLPALH